MLNDKLRWLHHSQNLMDEFLQCKSEGKDISPFLEELNNIMTMCEGDEKENKACSLMRTLEELPSAQECPYYEPDIYKEIIATLDESYAEKYSFDTGNYREKLRGAWAGRAVGCLLGIPVETWERDKIKGFLRETGNFPISRYMSSQVSKEIEEKYMISNYDATTPYDRQKTCWINNVKQFPVDDDTNYTIASLRLVERFGTDFSTDNVAESWLFGFPVLHACTAERIAYKNLVNCILPPLSAKHLNPFREWIGAQIRADFYGYIAPGNPSLSASMAFRDAAVSHVKNGIYGAMYTAALISLAPCSKDQLWMVRTALKQIPPSSRLFEFISKLCEMYSNKMNYDELVDFVHAKFDQKNWFDWCHTIPNAALVTINLLYHGQDFNTAVTNTVMCGFDTDCNGATVGSITGMMCGFKEIDTTWLNPIEQRLSTSIHGYHSLTIDEFVERTYKLVKW